MREAREKENKRQEENEARNIGKRAKLGDDEKGARAKNCIRQVGKTTIGRMKK